MVSIAAHSAFTVYLIWVNYARASLANCGKRGLNTTPYSVLENDIVHIKRCNLCILHLIRRGHRQVTCALHTLLSDEHPHHEKHRAIFPRLFVRTCLGSITLRHSCSKNVKNIHFETATEAMPSTARASKRAGVRRFPCRAGQQCQYARRHLPEVHALASIKQRGVVFTQT